MYCVRVQEGRERIEVRYYQNGFLPGYRPVNASGKAEGRRLVVPGYIFMLKQAPRTQKVPEAEWKVIEAVSDPRISVMDFASGEITEGPLKAVGNLISEAAPKRVKVSACLFGENREFWLPVRSKEEMEAAAAASDRPDCGETGREIRGNRKEKKTMAENNRMDFTEEQKERMAARAEEIGVHAAAAEFNVPWQTMGKIRRREAKKSISILETAAPDDPEALMKENQFLRRRVGELEKRINKMKTAFRELIDT